VATDDADETHMVTVWLAITDATKDNGCLRVVPDTQHAPMMPHCLEPQVGIPDRFVNEVAAKPLEVKKGGAIFFHPLTIHGAGDNVTDHLRWSFDLRYNITGEPTGRVHFPDFVARSKKDPSSEVHDPQQWAQMWAQTKQHMIDKEGLVFNRWDQNAPVCA
jgi:ectoine hydroxylase-related dioxygenase (phytanoyl-CoA dioxygenase family)